MGYGDQYPGRTQTMEFFINGGETTATITTTAETALTYSDDGAGTRTEWRAPWNCRVSEIFCEAQINLSGQTLDFRVRRSDIADIGTPVDLISNVDAAAVVDFVRLTSTAIDQYNRERFGNFDDNNQLDTVGLAATIFVETEAFFNTGDRMSATYQTGTAGATSTSSHVTCSVTVSRLE